MRKRAFVVAMLAGIALAGCQNPFQTNNDSGPANTMPGVGPVGDTRAAIQRVLDEDNRAGTTNNGPRAIHTAMQRIDLSGTPEEFRHAYEEHMRAWSDWADQADVGARMTGASEDQRRDWARRSGEIEGRIASTFANVTRIAGAFGARPPASSGRSGIGGIVEGRGGNQANPAPPPVEPPPAVDKPDM